MRKLQGNTAAELYEVQPNYQRFNQKYNMTRQGLWEPTWIERVRKRDMNRDELVEQNEPGYTRRDWAFYLGGRGNIHNTGFEINYPNRDGNSWQTVAKVASPGEKWRGDAFEATRMVRKMAQKFGANQVGFTLLDRRWVYSHYFDEKSGRDYPIKFTDEPGYEKYDSPIQLEDGMQVIPKEMKYVIVLIYEMGQDGMGTAPTLTQMAETLTTYSRISFTTVMLAEFVRGLGYNAIPSSNCTALSVPLAIDAGLGQLGRNAKLITPKFGPRCRISKVITDLPLVPDRPIDFGVTEFCNRCQKCARLCPSRAIPFGERSLEPVNECNHRGVFQWQLDHKRCYKFWTQVGTNCGICIRVCPFNKGKAKVHDVSRWAIRNVKQVDRLLIRLDDALRYGKQRRPQSFWE